MIPKQLDVGARSFLAGAVICGSLFPSAAVRAEEPPPSSSEEVVRPVAGTATADAAVNPRITMTRRWTGSVQEEFRLDIRFSQDVTGFTFDDIGVFGATPDRPSFIGTGKRYFVTMDTRANYEGTVIITIDGNAAHNAAGEGNRAGLFTFEVDNLAPTVEQAEVDGDELIVTFSEDLDESTIPSVSNFDVHVTRDGVFHTERVSRVEVDATEVILTLVRAVRFDDAVELAYDDVGARALRDEAGNLASGFDLSVRNDTDEGEAPGPPRSLTAVAVGASVIELNWRAPLDSGSSAIIGYWIEVSTDGGVTWSSRSTGSTTTRYRDTRLAPNTTRHYRVSAINSYDVGAPSNVASAKTEVPVPPVPDAPTRLTARARGTSAIDLDWTAPSSVSAAPITGYRIEVSSTGNSRWTALEADTDSRDTDYRHTGLNPGTTRYYRVAAINRVGRSAWSSVVSATTDVTAPGAPSGLRAVPSGLGGSGQLLLTWTRPSTNGGSSISGYRIEMSPNGVSGWTIVVANTRSTTYRHTGLAPGTTRYYRVSAINSVGRSNPSNVAPGTTKAARPGQVQTLSARATGPSSIAITWEAPSSDGGAPITGYSVRARSPNDGTWITIRSNTRSTATTFAHTNLQPFTAYRYQVRAINSVGPGQWSLETSTTTHPDVPSAPFNLTAGAVGTSRIDLSWSAPRNTGGAPILGYRIEASERRRAVPGGSSAATRTRRRRAYPDPNLEPATTRHYRVSAINTAGTGPASNTARHATTEAALPGVPRNLTAEADGTSEIDLSWQPPTDRRRRAGHRLP